MFLVCTLIVYILIYIFVLEHTRIIQLSVVAAVSKMHKANAVDPVSGEWFLLSHTLYILFWHICRIKHYIIFMHCKKLFYWSILCHMSKYINTIDWLFLIIDQKTWIGWAIPVFYRDVIMKCCKNIKIKHKSKILSILYQPEILLVEK